MMMEQWTREVFAQHLNSPFQVYGAGGSPVAVELVQLTDGPASARTESFSLLFRGPTDAFLAQGMYRFQHEHLGEADLFIVPVGHDQAGYTYEAVFNRLRQ